MTALAALRASERAAFERALHDARGLAVEVSLLTLEGDELSRISPTIIDGQVDVDADADVTRSCTVTFLDPSHSLQLDSDSPDDGALYADRLLRVVYSVWVPELDDRVDVPVFRGPIVAFDRAGDEVTVDALGLEELALGACWRPISLRKGMKKVDAIRTLLADRAGETRFAFPDLAERLPHTVSLGRAAIPWKRARSIARSLDRQLYYPGDGRVRLRHVPRRPVFTFRADDPTRSTITGEVAVSHDFTDVRNAVWLKGGKPKGAKHPVIGLAVAPKGHPLSPHRLGRNGVPRYLVDEVTNDHLRSKKAAQRRAHRILEDHLIETTGVTFTALPVPHLDPLDVVRVVTDDFAANVRIRKFSLPLAAGGTMSVGYHLRVSKPRVRAIRARRKKGGKR